MGAGAPQRQAGPAARATPAPTDTPAGGLRPRRVPTGAGKRQSARAGPRCTGLERDCPWRSSCGPGRFAPGCAGLVVLADRQRCRAAAPLGRPAPALGPTPAARRSRWGLRPHLGRGGSGGPAGTGSPGGSGLRTRAGHPGARCRSRASRAPRGPLAPGRRLPPGRQRCGRSLCQWLCLACALPGRCAADRERTAARSRSRRACAAPGRTAAPPVLATVVPSW